jgi:hypothetical protein
MTVNYEARRFGDEHQAQSLADWIDGIPYTGNQHGHTDPPWQQHTCITLPDGAPGKSTAGIGDWIIKGADGTVRAEPGGNQAGYCTDCGLPVWWSHRDGEGLITRGIDGTRWCYGKDEAHFGMTHHHALPGMAQWVVRAAEGKVCRCLDRSGPHIHEITMVPPETAHRLWRARMADGDDILADLRAGDGHVTDQAEADRRLWDLLEQAERERL